MKTDANKEPAPLKRRGKGSVTNSPKLTLALTSLQKSQLLVEAKKRGFGESLTQFVAAIAEGHLVYIDSDAALLLDHIKKSGAEG